MRLERPKWLALLAIAFAMSCIAACTGENALVQAPALDGGSGDCGGMADAGRIADATAMADAGGTADAGAMADASGTADGGTMACGASASTMVTTPFDSPNDKLTFTTPTIPCNVFDITKYGAKGDGTTKNTDAFRQAVAAAKVAGGVVDVPAGNWLTGPIRLESKVELHIEAGATVLFSTDFADYLPLVPTRWEGLDILNFSPLVYCLNCTDVAITGSGKLFGQGAYWWDWKGASATEDANMYNAILANIAANGGISACLPLADGGKQAEGGTVVEGGTQSEWGAPADAGASAEASTPAVGAMQTACCGALALPSSGKVMGLRPTMVECNGCKNFLIQDVTIEDGPYWTVHPLYSENVIIRGAHIHSGKEAPLADGGAKPSNGDGIDVDSCKKTLIEDTDFDTSDDNIAIKSGLNEDGICVGRPSEEVVVRRITSIAGHGGITVGSEMSGGVTNVFGTNSTLTGAGVQYPLRFKTLAGRGGTISNIFYDGITLGNWTTGGIIIDMSYPSSTLPPADMSLLPTVTNVSFKNISGPNNAPGVGMCPASATSCPPVTFRGIKQSPLQNISLSNVSLDGTASQCLSGMGSVTLTNVNIPGLPTNGTWACP